MLHALPGLRSPRRLTGDAGVQRRARRVGMGLVCAGIWALMVLGGATDAVAAVPGAFGKSTPANGATGRSTYPTVTWGAASGATSYTVCADTTNDNTCDTSWTNVGNVTSVTWPGPELAHDTVYYWQVRAVNASGFTAADSQTWWSFRTQVDAPAAFGKAAPANGATGQSTSPTLTWGTSARAASYAYCYDTTNDGVCGSSWTSTGTGTSVALSGLSGGTTYYWHARATNAGGTTYADSNTWWSFTTQPGAFSKLTPTNGATGRLLVPTVTWQASSGATSYEVCGDTTNNSTCDTSWTNVGNVTSATWPGPALAYDTLYYWQVRAIYGGVYTPADSATWWSFRTQVQEPGAFGKSAPTNGATGVSTSPNLTWGPSTRATSYEYCYDTTNDGACGGSWTSTGTGTSVGLSGLSNGTTYYWHVRAMNAGGTTYADGLTTWWSFTTRPGAFSKVTPVNGATGQARNPSASWAASAGATSYEVCADTVNNSACDTGWVSVGTATSVTWPGAALAYDTVYYWQVRALYAGGDTPADSGAWWNFRTQVEKPDAFGKSGPANGATAQPTNPTLSWGIATRAASYEYCVDTTNDGACGGTWTSTGTGRSVALNGLTDGTTYYWHVRAVNAGGTTYAEGSTTAFWSFATAPGAFNKVSPTNTMEAATPDQTLTWGASAGATSYEYCYDTTFDSVCGGSWTNVGNVTSVALSGLSYITEYQWQVRAVYAGGTTAANGGTWWGFTVQIAPPGAFVKSLPTNGATGVSTSPTLTWEPSAGVSQYQYCYDTTNDGACSAWTSAGVATSIGLSGLSHGTTYYWHVRAWNGSGTTYAGGSETAYSSFTTVIAKPEAFGKVSPANGATGLSLTPTVTWSASSGAASYEVCGDTTDNGACDASWVSVGTATTVTWPGPALAYDTLYYWQVRAMNAGGYTPADSATWWNLRTKVEQPDAFGKSAPVNGETGVSTSPTLTWETSERAASYEYCVDTTTDGKCGGTWTSTGATPSVALSGLSPATTYSWHVRALNAGGYTYGDGSVTWWSFTTRPGAFAKVTPANGATGRSLTPTFTWSASTGATSYEVCGDTTNNGACDASWVSVGTATTVTWPGPALAYNTLYYWQVRALYAGGDTPADSGSWWSFGTQVEAPGAFAKQTPVNGAPDLPTSTTLTWGASARAASYEYCVDTSNDGACAVGWTASGTSRTATLTGLSGATTYYWQVRAVNPSGTPGADGDAWWSFTTEVAPGSTTWTPTGELAKRRAGHTATLLMNGQVLVAGKIPSPDEINDGGELYDPAVGTWTWTSLLNYPRYYHSATLLPGGQVLVAGGRSFTGDYLTVAELYDPATRTWTETGSLTTGRVSHTASLLPDGRVLVAGGTDGENALATAELYDPATGLWTAAEPMAADRSRHTATLLADGQVLVAGGYCCGGEVALRSAELYDPGTGAWSAAIPMQQTRSAHTATLLPNGNVLVAGGVHIIGVELFSVWSSELYEPATKTWTETGLLGLSRADHTATLLLNGQVLIAGGVYVEEGKSSPTGMAERYDPSTGIWVAARPMESKRAYHTATLLPNGQVLAAGGWDARSGDAVFTLASAELYGSGTPVVASVTPATGPALGRTAITIAGTAFVKGATVTVGGVAAEQVVVVNTSTIRAVTPAHARGAVDVVVTNPAGQAGMLSGGFAYLEVTPAITWPAPAAITYGVPLSVGQLNATSSVAGTFAYDPPAGTVLPVGVHTLSTVFTPTDMATYAPATATVSVIVDPVTPVVDWVTPAAITYGTPLGGTQLNASTGVAGTFVYDPPAGTVLPVGAHTLWTTFTPTDAVHFAQVTKTVAIEVLAGGAGRAVPFDFTADGKSDVLWRHATGGDVWLWPMDGAARSAETFVRTVADTDFEIRGLGDQNGDGQADILWRNKTNGQVYFWPMDGPTPLAETYVTTIDPAYDIVGTGDFNGDGKSDLLWRHLTHGDLWVWLMDGAMPLSQTYVDTVDLAYVVEGVADLDANGTADIVFHHQTLGEVWVWPMNGATRLSQDWVGTVPDVVYQIVGVADHTGDGRADLLWHHATLGEVWLWTMNGTTREAETWVGTVPDVGYQIVGSGDYNGDGKADLLWRNAVNGEVWVWLMDGATKLSENYVGTVPDTGYQIVKTK